MIAVHLAHVCVFGAAALHRDTLTETTIRTLDDLAVIHGGMVLVTGVLTMLLFRSRPTAAQRLMSPVVATLYLAHGAVCTAVNLLVVQSVTTYVGYCLAMAVILCIAPRTAVIAYGIGILTLVVSLLVMQRSVVTFVETMPTCVAITAVGVALASVLHAGRLREFQQRLTIKEQHDLLSMRNVNLECRVEAQAGESVTRAKEIEQLNAQLQAQVRARSSELSLALARLAHQRRSGDAVLRGTVLGGRFTVGDLIGEGAMGAVHEGVDQLTGGRIAIKVVQATSTRTLNALRRFAREAGAAAAITHPAVVRMFDVGISDDGLLFQVQELIEGVPLARLANQAWPPGDAARLGVVLCGALAAAHAADVVHRDVKPENIMLTGSAPGLKLLDFGIAKLYEEVHSHSAGATRTGVIIGTPAYMAPEQMFSGNDVGDRADVYAAGVVLFRLLSERHPFEAGSLREMMMSRLLRDAPGVQTFQPSVPASLAQLVDRCLARHSEARPSAAELAYHLAVWADTVGAPALELRIRSRGSIVTTLSGAACSTQSRADPSTLSRIGDR